MIKVVYVTMGSEPKEGKNYLYLVPMCADLRKGDLVALPTGKVKTIGNCSADSFLISEDNLKLMLAETKIGILQLKMVLGRAYKTVSYEVQLF